ncbi:MAG TPA: site-2 protease family protein [Candidatus Polarisedimenticolia bacterium]|nr:site-2 protease family protein [Candidatus Polarisedimenticolia bacterium]
MVWSFRLGTVLGIPIRVHITFLILLLLLAGNEASRAGLISGVRIFLLIVLLFSCVLLHELGHCVVARRFGVAIASITLYPLGGIAVLDDIPRQPAREILIALAGPAVNFLIAGGLWLLDTLASAAPVLAWDAPPGADLLGGLLWANLGLGVFNLIPAYPMDGGRVLRGILATRLPYPRATQIAARVGKGFGGVFVLGGIFLEDWWLPVIGVFLYLVANSEEQVAQLYGALENLKVEDMMIRDYLALSPADSLGDAARLSLHSLQEDFPVVRDGVFVGVVNRAKMAEGLREPREASVQSVTQPVEARLHPADPLREALRRMRVERVGLLPVIDESGLRGIVTLSGILRGAALLAGAGRGSQEPQR